MIRSIASAALLGALIAGGFVYAAREPALRNSIQGWLGFPAETSVATAAWPICTALQAMGTESDWTDLDPDFAAGKKALVAENWNAAIIALKLAALRDWRNATSRTTSATPTGGWMIWGPRWGTISMR